MSRDVWEAVIGLEIHVQLSTRTKMFCGCELSFGDPPNTHVCPICLAHPGVLPVTNEKAIEYATRIALAFNCRIAPRTIFHRKNYFYPDLPKAYQISQFDLPLGIGGHLDVEMEDGSILRVGITRVHMEEDAGKLVHAGGASGRIEGADHSLVDFNRGGTPLVEIVTEPDISTPDQARAFLTQLRSLVQQLGVSDVNMEEGSMRCDANVSLRHPGQPLGTKTELKNMNSFRFLHRGLEAEIERQTYSLESGERIVQETVHFDPVSGKVSVLRSKEEAHDYRYFPEPDLPPI
jgi:aspartyl-tRNA(Asn)/glutamyl-tRNA(Gln) amidotransferase subunit B